MITGKQLVEKLYSEGWELEQREYGLLSKMKGFISKRNLEKYYRYKGELNRLKNEKSKIQGELSNLDERAPKNMKLERAIQREAINENSFVTRYAENSNVDIKDKKIKEVLKNSINNSDRVSERDKRKLSKLIDNRDHAIYYNRNQGGPASLAHEVGHIKGEKESKLSRHSGWASGLAVQSPGLVSEAMASKHGLDLMKKAGASKKLMKLVEKT